MTATMTTRGDESRAATLRLDRRPLFGRRAAPRPPLSCRPRTTPPPGALGDSCAMAMSVAGKDDSYGQVQDSCAAAPAAKCDGQRGHKNSGGKVPTLADVSDGLQVATPVAKWGRWRGRSDSSDQVADGPARIQLLRRTSAVNGVGAATTAAKLQTDRGRAARSILGIRTFIISLCRRHRRQQRALRVHLLRISPIRNARVEPNIWILLWLQFGVCLLSNNIFYITWLACLVADACTSLSSHMFKGSRSRPGSYKTSYANMTAHGGPMKIVMSIWHQLIIDHEKSHLVHSNNIVYVADRLSRYLHALVPGEIHNILFFISSYIPESSSLIYLKYPSITIFSELYVLL